jgi:hypothetical protein
MDSSPYPFRFGELLLELRGWSRHGGTLGKAYPATTEAEAMVLFSRVAIALCRAKRSALDVDSAGRTVRLSVHGRVGAADLDLVRRLDRLARPHLRPVGLGELSGEPRRQAGTPIGRGRPFKPGQAPHHA